MKVNWGVRFKNPVFLAQLACAVALPLITGAGARWEDMTTFPALFQTLAAGLSNPVVVVAMLTGLWACVTDPTTKGTGDSARAMGYTEPAEG